jgi:hypothetical protein
MFSDRSTGADDQPVEQFVLPPFEFGDRIQDRLP